MYDSVIKLVSESTTIDEYGDAVVETIETQHFAELKSIGQSEFYQASAVGLKPELKFVLADFLEYNNEEIVLYKPFNSDEEETYRVLRTYRANNTIELVCRKGLEDADS